LKKLAVELS